MNIVLFIVDQLSAKWLEGGSALACPTPNFDRLRRAGVTFTNAYASNPVCCAARATLATGLTSRGHGVLQNGYRLNPALPTVMKTLQDDGWQTGAFGKIHYEPHYRGFDTDYRPYGFDVVHNTEDSRGGEWLDWIEEAYPEHYEAALATVWPTSIPAFAAYGPRKTDLASRIRQIRKSFSWGTDKYPNGTRQYYVLPFPEQLSQTAWTTARALNFLENADPARPVYAHISYVQPHAPSCPPADYMDRIDLSHIPQPAPPTWVDDPHAPHCFRESHFQVETTAWRDRRHYYLADVAHLDHQLGLVVAALQNSGRWQESVLVFLSDHGDLLYDHGFFGKAERHYDACVRVPLIMAGPGLKQGHRCDAFVQLEDIVPTFLDLARLPQPQLSVQGQQLSGEIVPSLPGASLLPWCRGETPGGWRDAVYIESYNNTNSRLPQNWARTVRTREWRYTLYPGQTGEQLFRLSDDADETRNMAADADYAGIRRAMRDRLLEAVILQDYPHPARDLYALGVH